MSGDETIIAMQERIAFLERHIEELDGVVRELAERLGSAERRLERFGDDMRGRLDAMTERIAGGDGAAGSDDGDPAAHRPPHWDRAPGRGD